MRHRPDRLLPRRLLVGAVLSLGSVALIDLAPVVAAAQQVAEQPAVPGPGAVPRPVVPTPVPMLIGDDPMASVAAKALVEWGVFVSQHDLAAFGRFTRLRDAVAADAARRLGLESEALTTAWSMADSTHQLALLTAFSQLGVPYRRNQMRPGGAFDCSGLTGFAWSQVGTQLPRSSHFQYRAATRVALEQAQAGDLVWRPGHIMLHLGVEGAVIHAPQSGSSVEVDLLSPGRMRWMRYANPVVAP